MAEAYRNVIDHADAWPGLHRALDGLDAKNVDDLARRAQAAREIVQGAPLPADLVAEILAAYAQAESRVRRRAASRCEARPPPKTCPPRASHASTRPFSTSPARRGCSIRCACASRDCSKDRAISYRVDKSFDHFKVFQSVAVMNGALRPHRERRHRLARHRDRLSRRGLCHRRLWLGRERRARLVDPDEFYVFEPTPA